MNGWMNGLVNGWKDGWVNGRMNGWMDECRYTVQYIVLCCWYIYTWSVASILLLSRGSQSAKWAYMIRPTTVTRMRKRSDVTAANQIALKPFIHTHIHTLVHTHVLTDIHAYDDWWIGRIVYRQADRQTQADKVNRQSTKKRDDHPCRQTITHK